MTESACIERYPEAGFDLDNMEQRDDFYKSIFAVIRYCTSNDAKITPSNDNTKSKQINVHTPLWLVANHRTSKKLLSSMVQSQKERDYYLASPSLANSAHAD